MEVKNVTWDQALLLARGTLPTLTFLLPDPVDAASREQGTILKWKPLHFERRSDREVMLQVLPLLDEAPDEPVVVIADAMFAKTREPDVVAAASLAEYAASFQARFGERLFCGDVLLICRRGIVALHHEERIARVGFGTK